MKSFLRGTLLLLFFVSGVSAKPPQNPKVEPADLLIIHAKAYTVNSKQPWAQSIAARRGRIIAVGSDAGLAHFRASGTKVIDAGGKLVLPGFTDCHIHFFEGSIFLRRAHLENARNLAEALQTLRDYAAAHPGDSWLLGAGWNYSIFGEEKVPHKKYLDELFPDRPAYLDSFDGHTVWVNSKALTLAGITRATPNPSGGLIDRDAKTGEPTGVLREDGAMDLVKRIRPQAPRGEKLAALRAGMKLANENGLTRVHAAGGHFESNDFPQLDLYDELYRHGELTLRMYIAYFLDPPELRPQDLQMIEDAREKYSGEWLSAGVVKFRIDGVIETHTAAMLEPYTDNPSMVGPLFWAPEKYRAAVTELDKRGLQIFTHAVGDRAVRTALDAYENAQKVNRTSDRRNRIEHIETLSPADVPRFGKLGVIASMQPLHAYPDENTLSVWAGNIGPKRASRGFAWHDIATAGGQLAFGSDWNVVTLNPWEGLQMAVTRQTTEGLPAGGWLPQERVTLAQAVDAYTLGAAFAGRREKTEGSLESGKVADLIMVSQNVFEIDPHAIAQTKVLLTVVGGRVVYQADAK